MEAGFTTPRDCAPLIRHGNVVEQVADTSSRQYPAWILVGAEGIGKASTAYHIAARYLSDGGEGGGLFGEDATPTHDPTVLNLIRARSHPDLMVVDNPPESGRKTISVEQVREMNSFLHHTAAMGGWRVVIVDSLDDMTPNANNAMLKMLEEPPQRSIILMISHVSGAILPTIRSRSRIIRLDSLSDEECSQVVKSLFSDIDDEWLKTMVGLADGAPGRAVMATEGKVAEIYCETCEAITRTSPDLAAIDTIAEAWGGGGAKNQQRRRMGMLLFERLLYRSSLYGINPALSRPSTLSFELAAITKISARFSPSTLADLHDQWLIDWREAEALNVAMAPMIMRLMFRLCGVN